MSIRTDNSIDKRIIEMRNEKYGLLRMHKWLTGWDNFSQLDQQMVLAHILNILDQNNIAVSRNEVRYCFNKFYNKNDHGEKKTYLNWLYKEFGVKKGALVSADRSHKVVSEVKLSPPLHDNETTVEILNGGQK